MGRPEIDDFQVTADRQTGRKSVTNAPTGQYGDFILPYTSRKRRSRRTTLDRPMRRSNRSHKRDRAWSDPTGARVWSFE